MEDSILNSLPLFIKCFEGSTEVFELSGDQEKWLLALVKDVLTKAKVLFNYLAIQYSEELGFLLITGCSTNKEKVLTIIKEADIPEFNKNDIDSFTDIEIKLPAEIRSTKSFSLSYIKLAYAVKDYLKLSKDDIRALAVLIGKYISQYLGAEIRIRKGYILIKAANISFASRYQIYSELNSLHWIDLVTNKIKIGYWNNLVYYSHTMDMAEFDDFQDKIEKYTNNYYIAITGSYISDLAYNSNTNMLSLLYASFSAERVGIQTLIRNVCKS